MVLPSADLAKVFKLYASSSVGSACSSTAVFTAMPLTSKPRGYFHPWHLKHSTALHTRDITSSYYITKDCLKDCKILSYDQTHLAQATLLKNVVLLVDSYLSLLI